MGYDDPKDFYSDHGGKYVMNEGVARCTVFYPGFKTFPNVYTAGMNYCLI